MPRQGMEGAGGPWCGTSSPTVADASDADRWTLGAASVDRLLPAGGLDRAGLIELKPAAHGDWPAALAFAACLALRRCKGEAHGRPDAPQASARQMLWCVSSAFVAEHGRLHAHGLDELGLDPARLIAVEAPRPADALWALEEGLRSGALALAIGIVGEVGLTPSRRLGLAAAAGRTPALLLTLPASLPAPAARLRLRLARLPSAPHPLDPRAPGRPRLRLGLERCQGGLSMDASVFFDLEWCHDAHAFRVASVLADRSPAAAGASAGAGG